MPARTLKMKFGTRMSNRGKTPPIPSVLAARIEMRLRSISAELEKPGKKQEIKNLNGLREDAIELYKHVSTRQFKNRVACLNKSHVSSVETASFSLRSIIKSVKPGSATLKSLTDRDEEIDLRTGISFHVISVNYLKNILEKLREEKL